MILYIDPGTGSMLITIIIGLFGTALYFLRNLFLKVRFFGKKDKSNGEKLPIVIFSDDKRYWNVFEPICDELEKREEKAVYMTESEDDPALKKEYKFVETKCIGKGNMAYAKLNNVNAHVVVSTTPSLDVFQWKRSKNADHYIHVMHTPSDVAMYKMFGIDYYDSILLSGKYQGEQVRTLEKERSLPEKAIEYVGIPYLDVMKNRLDSEKKNEKKTGDVTVLLAPSWGDNGILKKYGSDFIDKLLDTGYKVIVRPHPQSFTTEKDMIDALMEKYPDSDKISWNRDNDNFNVLKESDILISDFSGVIFEYALVFDKPVIYTAADYDKSTYDCAWLEKELWTFDVLPKIGMELSTDNFGNVKELIDKCISSEEYAKGRDNARKETWMYPGEGAKRTVDYIVAKLRDLESDEEEISSETVTEG